MRAPCELSMASNSTSEGFDEIMAKRNHELIQRQQQCEVFSRKGILEVNTVKACDYENLNFKNLLG